MKKVTESYDTVRIGSRLLVYTSSGCLSSKKFDKIRVLFDYSTRYAGRSLNATSENETQVKNGASCAKAVQTQVTGIEMSLVMVRELSGDKHRTEHQ